jgi:hypothetical protein
MKQKHTRVLTPVFVVGLSDVDVLAISRFDLCSWYVVCMYGLTPDRVPTMFGGDVALNNTKWLEERLTKEKGQE